MKVEEFKQILKDYEDTCFDPTYIELTTQHLYKWITEHLQYYTTRTITLEEFTEIYKKTPKKLKRLLLYSYLTKITKINNTIRGGRKWDLYIAINNNNEIAIYLKNKSGNIVPSAYTAKNLQLMPLQPDKDLIFIMDKQLYKILANRHEL